MKQLNEIRYFLFAIMVLGCFANFAQNEYGLYVLYYSMLFIAFIFFIEAFVFYSRTIAESKTKAIYFFAEHFLLGSIFLGTFFKWEHILPPGPFLLFGALFLFVLYFIYAIRILIKESKKGRLTAWLIFVFILTAGLATLALSWKLQHQPGANIMLRISFFTALFLMLFAIIKRKYFYDGERITFKDRIMKLPGKIPMVFIYFTLWATHITLTIYGITPNFYTLSNPPAYEKLRGMNDTRSVDYNDNYYNFLGNRNNIQYK